MKKMNIIEKNMDKNNADISKYCGGLSNMKPPFGSDEEQRKEVMKRIQSNSDYIKEYLRLKRQLEFTNLVVKVKINGVNYSLSELLVIKRRLGTKMEKTFTSLDVNRLNNNLNSMRDSENKVPQVVQYYDEKFKNEELRKVQDLIDNITSRLETINATTPIIEDIDEKILTK